MDDKFKAILGTFKGLLTNRFAAMNEQNLCEEDIRLMFFLACKENGVPVNNIMLEKKDVIDVEKLGIPTTENGRAKTPKIDMLVLKDDKSPWLAIEFKYHRQEVGSSPQRHWAGRLIHDFYRLQCLNCTADKDFKRLAVYVANNQMMKIYDGMNKTDSDGKASDWGKFLYDMMHIPAVKSPNDKNHPVAIGEYEEKNMSKAFRERKGNFSSCTVRCHMNETLLGKAEDGTKIENALRIFEIS